MREIVQTIKVYSIEELPTTKAKQRAISWLQETFDFPYEDDWRESVEAFCAFFGVRLLSYQADSWATSYRTTEIKNENFRGKKLKDFYPEYMPTGYCGDCPLWRTFHEVFKNTGDAKHAFKTALEAGFEEWKQDIQDYYSDESIVEHAICNEYEFTEDGNIYN